MSLFGVSNVHEPQATEVLEYSVTEWLKEGLLQGGAFLNVASGVSLGTLRESPRPNLTARTVYQSARADWVWESGVAYTPQPIRASGAWVNGVFRAFASGCVPDFPAGSVTFSPALAAGSTVLMNYSARTVRVFNPRACPWYATQFDSYDAAQAGSGTWSPDGRTRVQLPAVFVQAVPHVGRFEGYELGSLKRIHKQDVLFHIVAERPGDRDRLHDALVSQWETRFNGVDRVQLLRDGRQDLLASGNINPSGVGGYTAQAALYPWSQIRVREIESTPGRNPIPGRDDLPPDSPNLFEAVVRWGVECDLPSS